MTDKYPVGKLTYAYRCEAGHLTQSMRPLKESTCWWCVSGEPCREPLRQESPKEKS